MLQYVHFKQDINVVVLQLRDLWFAIDYSYYSTQIEYETAAESQREDLASKLINDFLDQRNGVSDCCLIYWKCAWLHV